MAPTRLPTIMEKVVQVARAPNVGDLERHIEFSRRCLALVPPSLLAPDHDVVPCLHGSCVAD
jgi:hypothetical protein